MRITRVKKVVKAALWGGWLCAGVANAGTELNKLVTVVGLADNAAYTVLLNPGDSNECFYGLIRVPDDANKSARLAMLISAKLTETPVSIDYNHDGQGDCVMTNIKIGG